MQKIHKEFSLKWTQTDRCVSCLLSLTPSTGNSHQNTLLEKWHGGVTWFPLGKGKGCLPLVIPREWFFRFGLVGFKSSEPGLTKPLLCSYNSLRKLSPTDFAGLEKLELLMLHSNEISVIPERAFSDLRSLQVRTNWPGVTLCYDLTFIDTGGQGQSSSCSISVSCVLPYSHESQQPPKPRIPMGNVSPPQAGLRYRVKSMTNILVDTSQLYLSSQNSLSAERRKIAKLQLLCVKKESCHC